MVTAPPRDPLAAWSALTDELDRWAAAGRQASFWWRDDDATAVTGPLRKLTGLSTQAGAPLALAVVPQPMTPDLAPFLATTPQVSVVQHGYAHINHARQRGGGAWELGRDRPTPTVLSELAAGYEKLQWAFADLFVPLIVPPWNRIHADVTAGLPTVGLHGLSTFGPRQAANPAPGVTQINAHCDPVKWKGGARFTGTARAIDDFLDHLQGRRTGRVDGAEPTGLLTHHLELDADCWTFVEILLAYINRHPAARWCPVAEFLQA